MRLDTDPAQADGLPVEFEDASREGGQSEVRSRNIVGLTMLVKGKKPISHLIAALSDIDGVHEVGVTGEMELE